MINAFKPAYFEDSSNYFLVVDDGDQSMCFNHSSHLLIASLFTLGALFY